MNKHRYQAKELQRVDWTRLAEDVIGQRLVFSVDVAKEDFYRAFMVSPSEALVTIKWQHPGETPSLGGYLGALPATRIEVVLETQRNLRRQPAWLSAWPGVRNLLGLAEAGA